MPKSKRVIAAWGSGTPTGYWGWQYTDGQAQWASVYGYPSSTPPFGRCDHNAYIGAGGMPGMLKSVGLGTTPAPTPTPTPTPTPEEDMPSTAHLGHTKPQKLVAGKWAYILWDTAYVDPAKMFRAGSGAVVNVSGRPLITTLSVEVVPVDATKAPPKDIRTRPVYIKPVANAPHIASALEGLEHIPTAGNSYIVDTRAFKVQTGKYLGFSIYTDVDATINHAGLYVHYW